jgi:hypothetical protein
MNLYFFIFDQKDLDKTALKWLSDRNFYLRPILTPSSRRSFVYFTQWTYDVLLSKIHNVPYQFKELLKKPNKISLTPQERLELGKRNQIHQGFPLADLPPVDVLEEVYAFLYANPTFQVQYLGRGSKEDYSFEDLRDFEQKDRSRHYWWRIFDEQDIFGEGGKPSSSECFENLCRWFRDDEARVVLSLGSGGLRLFSLIPFLHFLEDHGLVDQLDEIWGCSGGSVASYLLTHYIPTDVFQNIAYRVHEHAYTDDEIPLASNVREWIRKIWKSRLGRTWYLQGLIDFSTFTNQMLTKAKSYAPEKDPLPFFTLSHNYTLKKNIVFSNQPVPEHLKEFTRFLGDSPFKMVTASSAIPVLFRRELIKNDLGEEEQWSDGVLFEETPLASIIRKWHADRRYLPGTPKKLKIFYVDLGVGFQELFPKSEHSKYIKNFVNYSQDIWKRQRTSLELALANSSNIEIKGLEVRLGYLGLLNPKLIPSIIHRGYGFFQSELNRLDLELKDFEK